MPIVELFKNNIKNVCKFNNIVQVNLFIIAIATIVFQGLLFSIIDVKKFKAKTWIFYLLFGVMSNIFYYKTFAEST
jgi:hypothetical protein